ncbi:hypothetical protein A4X13_0g3771 [Tilletia indica]|uniref:Uncharacterized protein n=1 Tax=Tilletia indica TaxID=43049 RepID=A0A177TP24_9BASI|nr:hypothetical protein A4X13_0g3771 [Tilletia indica]
MTTPASSYQRQAHPQYQSQPGMPQMPPAAPPTPSLATRLFDVRDLTTKADVGRQPGVKWSLSSHKPGNGVQDLLHPDISRLWQSDGTQPHFINIQFPKRTAITHVSIYLDHKLDDSYTPTKLLIKGGTYFHDLVDIRYRELTEPSGWKTFILVKSNARIPEEAELESYTVAGAPTSSAASTTATPLIPIHAWLLQICILGNHLNGKDTHVRGIYIFGPPTQLPAFLPGSQIPKFTGTLDDVLYGSKGKGKNRSRGRNGAQVDDDDDDEDDSDDGILTLSSQDDALLGVGGASGGMAAVGQSSSSRTNRQDDLLPPLSRNMMLGSSVR